VGVIRITKRGLERIANYEGFSHTPYREPNGTWAIGYGHNKPYKTDLPSWISREDALELFRKDIRRYESAVRDAVKVPISQCEYNALVSLCYNLGTGGFERSRVVYRLNRKQRFLAGAAFLLYVNSGGIRLLGLVRRRISERSLFRKKCYAYGGRRVLPKVGF
jgi:lysozyme